MRSVKHSEAARINGAKAGTLSKQRAIERYYKSPNFCKSCENVIQLKGKQRPFEVRKKSFCSHSCAAKFNHKFNSRVSDNIRSCPACGKQIRNKLTKHCIDCRSVFLHDQTGNLLKGEVSRERISAHARRVIKDRLSACVVCGYDFAVEAAHIKAVKDYPGDTTVKEINRLENLIPLCPNHHLEFDRGKIKLEDFALVV